jgi:hypothetical protein
MKSMIENIIKLTSFLLPGKFSAKQLQLIPVTVIENNTKMPVNSRT